MAGGSWEYAMGSVYNADNHTIAINNSGFNQDTIDDNNMEKYIDKFIYGESHSNQEAYNRRILGDATGEVRGWNSDSAYIPVTSSSWIVRGGGYSKNIETGVFYFGHDYGHAKNIISFRIVRITD